MQLVKDIYVLSKSFPQEEQLGLHSQSKRAVVSIPSNIAEGIGRQYKKDTLPFFHIARGSIYEVGTQVHVALMVEIVKESDVKQVTSALETVLKLLNGLINSYEKRADLK